MAAPSFSFALNEVFSHEGGYVDHPKDPGGATNFGITHSTLAGWRGRKVTKSDVRNLTRGEAADIYKARYWDRVRGDDLPAGVDLVTFDPAVNSGVKQASLWLQRAVGMTGKDADGKIGPATVNAAKRRLSVEIIRSVSTQRLGMLRGLKTWSTFGRGWSRRVASVEAAALKLAVGTNQSLVRLSDSARADAKADNSKAAGAGGGGAAGVVGSEQIVTDAPNWLPWLIVAIVGLIIVNYVGRARVSKDRSEAIAAASKG